MDHNDLFEEAMRQFKEYYSQNQLPGSTSNIGVSQECYNSFAKWDLWKGGYVERVGYVGPPSSSDVYGAPLLRNYSWVKQGGADTPLYPGKFYKLDQEKKWEGGYIESWGYVEKDKHVLGASTSIRFATKSGAYDDQLLNIVNLSIEVSRAPFNLDNVREYFLQYWNEHTNTYDIDDRMLRKYLDERLEPVRQILTIPEALEKHYGVLLRSVNRTVEENSQVLKYGRDYLILAYNPVLQQYIALSPEGNVVSLDALKINKGETDTVTFMYYHAQ